MIELLGDIGSGKTTFTRGVLEGLGYEGEVISPTYTVSRTYPLPYNLTLHHFDFYRLEGHDITTEEFEEASLDAESITLIEWPGSGGVSLPDRRLTIRLTAGQAENQREIVVSSKHSAFNQIITGLRHDSRT